jgi:predicted nucleotidyltransferase component of viral defense system
LYLAILRREIMAALFLDAFLLDRLVIKGGNALDIIHNINQRASVDIDFSIADEFLDQQDAQDRIKRALSQRFERLGLVVFDYSFEERPPEMPNDPLPWWGGYAVEFKIIDKAVFDSLGLTPEKRSIQAIVIAPQQARIFRIDISKNEYCGGKEEAEIGGVRVYVYSVEMCVFEKLRSICQQMPQYTEILTRHGRPRARDFYDIYATVTRRGVDLSLPENQRLCERIFEAKHVPMHLLTQIGNTREFHRADWDSVKVAVYGDVFEFDYYFEFVVGEVNRLNALWKIETP